MSVSVGAIVEGVVTGITNFGAFVELPGGTTGLVHISEVADSYVKDVKDFLKEKDKIKVKIIHVDEKGKIGLSIKQVNPPKVTMNSKRERGNMNFNRERGNRGRINTESFEDKLQKFMKDSEEIQSAFRKSTDSKRGGRGSSRF